MTHHDEDLPRFAAVDDTALARARTLAVHSPGTTGDGGLVWTLTVHDHDGMPLARERLAAPDWPTPLDHVVAPHLDVARLRVVGAWRTDLGDDDLPRHTVRVAPDT